jgi:hypothetical protein
VVTDQPSRPGSLAAALIAFQQRKIRIPKTADAQYGKYADLSVITDIVMPVLAELGLYWVCCPTLLDGQFVLDYALKHVDDTAEASGQYPLPASSPQTQGGAITYARRYALLAVLSIAPAEDDDDAQAAEQSARADASRGSDWRAPANPTSRKAVRSRDTAGEDTAWNTPEGENLPGSITSKQTQRIAILMGEVGATERTDRLALAVKLLNLPGLASSKDLSMAQGTELIRLLQAEADKT